MPRRLGVGPLNLRSNDFWLARGAAFNPVPKANLGGSLQELLASSIEMGFMDTWMFLSLATLLLYCLFILVLVLMGRRQLARAVAGFIPDCLVLFRRLLSDPRIPRSRKLLVAVMVGYLAMPLDVIPDFIPVAGQLDDAVLVALVLKMLLKGGRRDLVKEHWPGPQSSLNLLMRLAGTP